MNRFYVFGFLIFFFLAWNKYKHIILSENKLPDSLSLGTNQIDPCNGKKLCAIAYVAPWCPACHQVAPHIRNFILNSKKQDVLGLLVVVGGGTEEQNQSNHKTFTSNAIIDDDLKIAKSLGVSYYPTFLVVDEHRKIMKRDQEALTWMQQSFSK